jgi:hypothetical protein
LRDITRNSKADIAAREPSAIASGKSPPAQSRDRLYEWPQDLFGGGLPIRDVLLQSVPGEVASLIQNLLVFFRDYFAKKFHSETCNHGTNSPSAIAIFLSDTGWAVYPET